MYGECDSGCRSHQSSLVGLKKTLGNIVALIYLKRLVQSPEVEALRRSYTFNCCEVSSQGLIAVIGMGVHDILSVDIPKWGGVASARNMAVRMRCPCGGVILNSHEWTHLPVTLLLFLGM